MRAYERLVKYVQVHTSSSEDLSRTPTTERQFDLSRMLADEMKALGLEDVFVDEHAYTYGFLPATPGCENLPCVAFNAHLDTIPDTDFPGKNVTFALFLALMMIPNELVIITNYVTITTWDMKNTFWGLILPSVTSVFYIYLLKENFEQIPEELYKAAKVDGCTDFGYLTKVMIPISSPTLVTITILKVIECWNSYVWPRLITDDSDYYLVANGIQQIREGGFGRDNIPAMMAAVVVVSIPLIVLFLIFHKKIMAGVSRGGTKG